jgi:hypothetical protein
MIPKIKRIIALLNRLDLALASDKVSLLSSFGCIVIFNFLQIVLAASILANMASPIAAIFFLFVSLVLLKKTIADRNGKKSKRIYFGITVITLLLNLGITAPFLLLYGKFFVLSLLLTLAIIISSLNKKNYGLAIFTVFTTWLIALVIALLLGYAPMVLVTIIVIGTLIVGIVNAKDLEALIIYRPFLAVNQISLILSLQTIFFGLTLPVYSLGAILQQPGVSTVLSYRSSDPKVDIFCDGLKRNIYPRILNTVTATCDNKKLFVGFAMASDTPILIDLAQDSVGIVEGMLHQETRSVVSDCSKGIHFFLFEDQLQPIIDRNGTITALPARSIENLLKEAAANLSEPEAEKLLNAENAYQLVFDAKNSKTYFSHKYGDQSFEVILHNDQLSFAHPIPATILVPDGETLYSFTRTGKIKYLRGSEQQRAAKRYNVDSKFTNLVLNAAHNKIYKSKFFSGDVAIIDTISLEEVKLLSLKSGTRSILYSDKFQMLIVANYTTGEVTFIDGKSDRPIVEYNFGWRVRQLDFDRTGEKIIIPCAHGIFTVDLNFIEQKRSDL